MYVLYVHTYVYKIHMQLTVSALHTYTVHISRLLYAHVTLYVVTGCNAILVVENYAWYAEKQCTYLFYVLSCAKTFEKQVKRLAVHVEERIFVCAKSSTGQVSAQN